jgi:large subunit ribosomal protein L15
LLHAKTEKFKLLARGTVAKKLTVRAHKFSAKAREAIEAAGGAVEEIAS